MNKGAFYLRTISSFYNTIVGWMKIEITIKYEAPRHNLFETVQNWSFIKKQILNLKTLLKKKRHFWYGKHNL